MRRLVMASSFIFALTGSTLAQQPLSDTDYMKQALASAPEAIAKNAAVVRPEQGNEMKILRQGTNGFTCMIMGTDRMCADAHALEFVHAMMAQKPPPANQLGIAYMLGGDTGPQGEVGGASNTDPSATVKKADNHWVVTGPHIMLFGPPAKTLGYPEVADPDPTRPYMMWIGTPYEHAMVPVK